MYWPAIADRVLVNVVNELGVLEGQNSILCAVKWPVHVFVSAKRAILLHAVRGDTIRAFTSLTSLFVCIEYKSVSDHRTAFTSVESRRSTLVFQAW